MASDPTPPAMQPEPPPHGQTPPAPPPPGSFAYTGAPSGVFVEIDRPCIGCSYNLRGLPVNGTCPECGKDVQFSLRGILLQFASPEYLATMRSGASLVLNGILLSICVMVIGILGVAAASAGMGASVTKGSAFELIMAIAQLIPTGMIILGYWRFTQPDPGFVGIEKPDSARSIVRITVCVQAGFQVLNLLIIFIGYSALGSIGIFAGVFAILLAIVSVIAWAVQFFAMMRYLKWLAARIPDSFMIQRTATYIWLLPLLYTVGSLVCVGPIIALVLYWNFLDRIRKHLRAIVETGQPAALPGTAN